MVRNDPPHTETQRHPQGHADALDGGAGDCLDNSIVESFFESLKAELGWTRNRQTKRKVKVARFDYLKSFYNPWRKHSGSGGKSPWLTYKAPPVISTDWNDPGQAQSHAGNPPILNGVRS